MLDDVYRVTRYGTLDDLLASRAKCLRLVAECAQPDFPPFKRGWLRTAERHLPLYDAEILARREKGEETVAEELFRITGNRFRVLRAR